MYLAGANTYTGGTTINGPNGILSIGNGGTTGTLPGNVTDNGALIFNRSDSVAYNGVISGSGTLTKSGGGNLTLNATHAYSGATTVAAGTLTLQDTNGALAGTSAVTVQNGATLTLDNTTLGNNNNRIADAAGITLAGGKLNYLGNAAGSTETLGALAVSNGPAAVVATSNGGTVGLNFGSLARSLGGTVDFTLPASGSITTTTANQTGGILGGYATVGGTNWATASGAGPAYSIAALTTYTNDTWAAGNNTTVTQSSSPASGSTTNSLQFNSNAGAYTVTLAGTNVISSGGILVTPNVGANNQIITGGTLNAASGGDLVVIQNNTAAPLTIASVIGAGTTGGLTKSGPGTLVLTGTNLYTGGTFINGGTLNINKVQNLHSLPITFNGGTLQAGVDAINLPVAMTTTINGGGATYDTNGFTLTVTDVNSGVGSLTKIGGGTLVLAKANTYTGGTFVNNGTLQVGIANALLSTSDLTVNSGGTLDVHGFAQAVATLNGGGAIINNGAALATLTVGNANSLDSGGTFSGTLVDGSAKLALAKAGTGILTLTGNSSYSGGTTLSAGTLRATNATSLGTGQIAFATTSVLDLRNDTGTNFGNSVAVTGGPGQVYTINVDQAVNGTGTGQTHTLGNVSTAGQTLTITGGNGYGLNLGTVTTSGASTYTNSAPGTLTIAGITETSATPVTVTINGTGNSAVTGSISDGGSTAALTLQKGAASTLTLSGVNTYHGGTNINGGVLAISSDANLGDSVGAINFTAASTLRTVNSGITSARSVTLPTAGTFDSNGFNSTLSGVISGVAGFTKTGAGILTLTGANTYAGATTVSGGTLQVSTSGNLGTGTAVSIGNGTLDLRNDTGTTFSQNVTVTGAAGINVDQAVGGGGANQTHTLGTLAIGAQTLTVTGGNGYGLTLGAVTASDAATIVNNAPGTLSLASLTQTNTAATTVTLGGTGSTTISGSINQGTGALSLLSNGAGTLTLGGANSYTGGTTINSGIVNINNNNALGTTGSLVFGGGTLQAGAGALVLNQNVTLNSAGGTIDTNGYTLTTLGTIGGTGGLIKLGGGTLVVAAAANYSGGTTINAGTLQIGGNNTLLNTGALTVGSGGAFDLNGFNQTVDALNGGGTISSSAAGNTLSTLTTGSNNSGGTFSGSINNGATAVVALAKLGSGTLTLTGPNTYSGGTTINAGTLQIASHNSLSTTGALTVSSGGAFDLNGFNQTVDALNGGGTISSSAAGNTVSTLTVGSNNSGGTFSGSINNGATAVVALAKSGSGTLTLTGPNTYSGGTTINAGTLQIGSHNSLSTTGALTVNSGSSFDLNGFNQTVDALNGGGTISSSAAGNTVSTLTVGSNNGSGAFAGVITNGATAVVALAKSGSGTLTVSGANTYSGGTTINGGTLLANNTSGSATGSGAVLVASGGTLGGSGIIGGPVTVQSGGTLSPGNSPGIITVTNAVAFDAGASFYVEINDRVAGTGYDQLQIVGDYNVALGGNLNAQFGGAWSPTHADVLYLVDNTGNGLTSGQFANFAESAVVGTYGGYEWAIDYNVDAATNNLTFGSGNDVALAPVYAVPEPSSWALLGTAGFTIVVGLGWRAWGPRSGPREPDDHRRTVTRVALRGWQRRRGWQL